VTEVPDPQRLKQEYTGTCEAEQPAMNAIGMQRILTLAKIDATGYYIN
jgi:hypothetical protein